MAVIMFIARVVLSIILDAPMVGEELDDDTRERMRQREEQLRQEMTRLLQELEQRNVELMIPEQRSFAWGALLLTALQQWQFWAIAGVLLVLSGLCLYLRSRSRRREVDSSSSEEESSSSDDEPMEEVEDDHEDANDVGRFLEQHIEWPVQNLRNDLQKVKELVNKLLFVFGHLRSRSFFPVLLLPTEVDSAFEGWPPYEEDIVYRVLVPMTPPRGHVFYLEGGTMPQMQMRYCHIRVELECTCTGERLVEGMLCFLHHPEEELRRNQAPSLLHTLCTDSYLDVEKTARWIHQLMKASWVALHESSQWRLKMLPPSRSCKFQIKTRNDTRLLIELMFGVQRSKSDVYVSNESAGALFTPTTMWVESYAVAEAKFFSHVAREAPRDSFHLKCLQLCTRILVGTSFSSYTMKTIVMHLLTSIPLSHWRRRDFLLRLLDIMRYLRCCLQEKRLDHFFFGNENVPEEIILPPAFQTAAPLNLFQHLQQDPAAHAEALREFGDLQDRLTRLLIFGH